MLLNLSNVTFNSCSNLITFNIFISSKPTATFKPVLLFLTHDYIYNELVRGGGDYSKNQNTTQCLTVQMNTTKLTPHSPTHEFHYSGTKFCFGLFSLKNTSL